MNHSAASIQESRLPAQLAETLCRAGQEHLVQFWAELDGQKQKELAAQLETIDFSLIENLFQAFQSGEHSSSTPTDFQQPVGHALNDSNPRFTVDNARLVGELALRSGILGVVIVAGGQGTRLGFEYPKGMYPIGPVSNATLFQILIEKVRAVSKTFEASIPLFLMTSPATHEATLAFLDEHDRFGLGEDELFVFSQATMPAVDRNTGKLILAQQGEIFRSPDGHGGLLAAMDSSGAFSTMKARGIEHLFYTQIDNPIVELLKPETIGQHILYNSDATTVVVRKSSPLEKVGNVALIEGRTQIIEYSDLPEEVANLRAEDGSLSLWAGNTGVHVWDVSFLESVAHDANGLPFHYAEKKVPCINSVGELIQPETPNAIKFERFIFDLLPLARRSIVVECDRTSTFAPLKNPTGAPTGTPESVREQIVTLYRSWIERAGGQVRDGVQVEISPLFADNEAELSKKLEPGTCFDKDTYLEG